MRSKATRRGKSQIKGMKGGEILYSVSKVIDRRQAVQWFSPLLEAGLQFSESSPPCACVRVLVCACVYGLLLFHSKRRHRDISRTANGALGAKPVAVTSSAAVSAVSGPDSVFVFSC